MRTCPTFRIVIMFVAAIAVAAPALAQNATDRRGVELAIGADVKVISKDGSSRTGRLFATSATQITVVDGGRLYTIPWVDIRQVERRSRSVSVRKVTLIGLGVGLGVGLVALATGGCTEDAGTFALECIGIFAGTGAGAGAAAGALMNSWRPTTIVFRADRRTFTVAPVLSRDFAGVSGTISW